MCVCLCLCVCAGGGGGGGVVVIILLWLLFVCFNRSMTLATELAEVQRFSTHVLGCFRFRC